jgi:V/A-type H+-transporting ATPase subunit E
MATNTEKTSSGVQELLDRLRAEGLEAGRFEGERALSHARDEAKRVAAAGKAEAEASVAKANEEIARFRRAGEEAILLAWRDALLAIRKQLAAMFEQVAAEAMRESLRDPALVRTLALEIAAKALAMKGESPEEGAAASTLLVPESADEALGGFVRANAEEMLRRGIELKADPSFAGGIRARLSDGELRVDLDDSALSAYLLRRMAPQFRAIVEAASKAPAKEGGSA